MASRAFRKERIDKENKKFKQASMIAWHDIFELNSSSTHCICLIGKNDEWHVL